MIRPFEPTVSINGFSVTFGFLNSFSSKELCVG